MTLEIEEKDRMTVCNALHERANEIAIYAEEHRKEMPEPVAKALSLYMADLRRIKDTVFQTFN